MCAARCRESGGCLCVSEGVLLRLGAGSGGGGWGLPLFSPLCLTTQGGANVELPCRSTVVAGLLQF